MVPKVKSFDTDILWYSFSRAEQLDSDVAPKKAQTEHAVKHRNLYYSVATPESDWDLEVCRTKACVGEGEETKPVFEPN